MNDQAARKVVIVGGGTAGWMASAAPASIREHRFRRIDLAGSLETVNVGEGAIQPIIQTNRTLADSMPAQKLHDTLARMRETMARGAESLQTHGDFIRRNCAFEPAKAPADRIVSKLRA